MRALQCVMSLRGRHMTCGALVEWICILFPVLGVSVAQGLSSVNTAIGTSLLHISLFL